MHRTNDNFFGFVRGRLCLREVDLNLGHLRHRRIKTLGDR